MVDVRSSNFSWFDNYETLVFTGVIIKEKITVSQSREKVMSASEAIRQFVKDGDELVIGNYTLCTCAELVYEVVRQKKKNLTVYSQSGIFDVEVMVAAGIVDRLITTYALLIDGCIRDKSNDILTGYITGPKGGPIAWNKLFWWLLVGCFSMGSDFSSTSGFWSALCAIKS